ncbi:MAG: putative metal-binding motif-containing protein [Alphaproteobacteria bacterium]|nr:putative metal-binding motif-containing protein [Alphaproteobacteria bacterium]
MLPLLLLACTKGAPLPTDDSAASDDTGVVDSGDDTAEADDTGVTDDTSDTGPVDADHDGFPRGEDCDDDNDRVYPGATEVFDGWDNDCDGQVDANGDFAGTFTGQAAAVYRGQTYRFSLSCPVTLTRQLSDVDFLVTCDTDPNDADAQRMLGAQLTMSPVDGYHWSHESWADRVEIVSSDGWDTYGEGTLDWPNVDRAELEIELSTTYLAISGGAVLLEAP